MTKNIFITGGTSGIGKSLIHKFARNNYNIFFTYFNNFAQAKSISKDLQKLNILHNYTKMDLTKIDSINNAFNKFSKQFKKLSIFINNASPAIERKNFLMLKNSDLLKNLKGLLIGNIASLKNALELALKNNPHNRSIIINISSYSAISGGKNIHLYAASKSAMNTLTVALSKDLFQRRIKIFSIVPRFIDTLTFRKNNGIKNNNDLMLFKKRRKIKKIKTPEEFANFIYKKIIITSNRPRKTVVYFDSF